MKNNLKQIPMYLPGIALSLVLVMTSMGISSIFPQLGNATYAILLGILLGNTIFTQKVWAKGTAFSEKRLLELSVFLLGYSISLDNFKQIGWRGMIVITTMLISTLMFVIWRGNKHRVTKSFAKLFASGNAICGSSAIAAVSDVIPSSEEERSQSIVLINLGGTILMLLLPLIGGAIFGTHIEKNGLLIGSIVQSVGQVAGAGSQMGPEILEVAMVTKIIRVLLLVFVVIYFSSNESQHRTNKKTNYLKFIPWYIIGFALLFALRTLFGANAFALTTTKSIGNWFELTALAAIGLRLNLRELIKKSKMLLVYLAETLIFQVLVSIALISILFML